MYYLTGNQKYLEAAQKIGEGQIKYTWDKKNHGWFYRFERKSPLTIDDSKDWWTQEEGNNLMIYLYHNTGDKKYLEKFRQSATFWDKYFVDKKYGECYQTLLADGTPKDRVKGTMFKSAYHSMEQTLFLYLYLSLYINKGEATLYFNLSSDSENEKHYVSLLEDPAVFINNVEINEKNWTNFDRNKCFISLPARKNQKVKVVLGMK
jgi:hypothetical protein